MTVSEKVLQNGNVSPFANAADEVKAFMASKRFIDLHRDEVHKTFTAITVGPDGSTPATDSEMDYLHDQLLAHFGATAKDDATFELEKAAIDEKFWPVVSEKIRVNAGLRRLMREFGIWSRYYIVFLYYIMTGHLALAVLPGQDVCPSVLDELEQIPPHDPGFIFCATDASFTMINFRVEKMQEAIRGKKKILFLGGGVDPAIWSRHYPTGKDGQQVIIYDTDPTLQPFLAQALGCEPEEVGVEFRNENFMEAFKDESLVGTCDVICMAGVASYLGEKLGPVLHMASKLLAPGGKIVFEKQIAHPVLKFDVVVLTWPTGMICDDSVESSIQIVQKTCDQYGLVLEKYEYEDKPDPAGAVYYVKKPEN